MIKEHVLWSEKYRPKKVDDCILPSELKSTFNKIIENNEVINLTLCGKQGIGKTTVARAICEQTNSDYIIINGSMNGNIDTLRTDIKNFASTTSLTGMRKVVILDEADYLNAKSTQPALRNFMEEYSKNCGFIMTCNFKHMIIEPLLSRSAVIDFKIPNDQKPHLAMAFFKRVKNILDNESIQYNENVVGELISKYFPDWRRVINELQRYSVTGKIDSGILTVISDERIDTLLTILKNKKFAEMRKWVAESADYDSTDLFRKVYDALNTHVKPSCIPTAIIILADYQYKSAFCADQEINTVACLCQLMAEMEFV